MLRKIVDSTWGRLSPLTKTIIVGGLGLLLLLLLWFYGTRAVNGVSSWFYNRGTAQQNQIIQGLQQEANAAKAVAAEALKELAKEKELTASLKLEREKRDKILADKTLNANEKLKKYEESLKREPVVSAPSDPDALCERARNLGIFCE